MSTASATDAATTTVTVENAFVILVSLPEAAKEGGRGVAMVPKSEIPNSTNVGVGFRVRLP